MRDEHKEYIEEQRPAGPDALRQPKDASGESPILRFMGGYMSKFRLRNVGRNLILHSHLPPLNSPAYSRFVKEHLLSRAPGPSHAQIGITNACPQRCEYCYNRNRRGQVMTKEMIKKAAAELKAMGVVWLGLTGEEPLLNKDIAEITESIARDCAVKLFTTGCALTREKAADLEQAGLFSVSVSLDHWTAEGHDSGRHYQGAFGQALKAIETFQSVGGVRTSVSAVLSRDRGHGPDSVPQDKEGPVGIRLTMARVYVPGSIRKRGIETLFGATADAFRVPVPATGHLTAADCLVSYAEFTRHHAEETLRRGGTREMQVRLFENARPLGEHLRSEFSVTSAQDVMRLVALAYGLTGIDCRGEPRGDITITHCFFRSYYSGPICQLISSLDAGLLAGLSGGGRLVFSERITEGLKCCRAYLDMAEETA